MSTVLSFGDDFEEAMRDLDFFSSELVKIIENELDRLLRDMEVERVGDSSEADKERMERDGISTDGRFNLDKSLDPIEPLRPLRPTPKPKKPLGISRKALTEMAEPLMDVFDNGVTLEVYVELPGAEKKDIRIKVRDGRVEVKTRNLRKVIELPTSENMNHVTSSDYRNGVLKIMIPKRFMLRSDDEHRTKAV